MHSQITQGGLLTNRPITLSGFLKTKKLQSNMFLKNRNGTEGGSSLWQILFGQGYRLRFAKHIYQNSQHFHFVWLTREINASKI